MFLWCLSDSLTALFHSLLPLWGSSIIKIVFPLFGWASNRTRQTRKVFAFRVFSISEKIIFLSLDIGFCSAATIIVNRLEELLHVFWHQHLILLFRILYYHFIYLVFHIFFWLWKIWNTLWFSGILALYCIVFFAPWYILKTVIRGIRKCRFSDYLALKTPMKRIANMHRNRSRNSLILELLDPKHHQSVKVAIILLLSCINSQEVKGRENIASTRLE